MSGRRSGNGIRGPQSALTDFLAANNIDANQIRNDFVRRAREAQLDGNAGEGSSTAQIDQAAEDAVIAAAAEIAQAEEDEEEEIKSAKKRKRKEKAAIDRIKKAKKSKKGKKRDPDDDDDDDDDFTLDSYKKSKPAPGQFENCELCDKRFTVTPYSKEGPDGGLLCAPCGKSFKKDLKKEQKAIAKKPAGRQRRKVESNKLDGIAVGGAKSLSQLCIERAVQHHEDLEELGDIPEALLGRLSQIFSKKRVMNAKTLPLFLRPELTSVIVHDAAYLNEEDYTQIFAVVPNMRNLCLSNACRFKDETMAYMLERCKELRHLTLYAANLVSDSLWLRLFTEAGGKLETIKLKWLDAAFDDASVEGMVINCPNLRRLKLKHCGRIGESAITAISRLQALEHVSLQIQGAVSSGVLTDLVKKRGASLSTLSLEGFVDGDDDLLQAIHDECHNLSKLRFNGNDLASDAAYTALFTEWSNPPLAFADFSSNRDVDNNNPAGPDEPIGLASNGFRALMEHSGSNLRHLDIASCRHIELGAFLDVFESKHYPLLEYINLSFCNRIDTTVVACIFKSCPNLKQLVAFGCFDVRDVVVPSNIALIGVPRAQDAIEQFGVGIEVEEALLRMRAEMET
ncbi:Hypothetical protein R9X50_00689300 [Acrodontium crateriforme]|uniref:DNA repair protein rhp7 treble clef domain-containing protein n=1 Tax=Acrodontium crateriforme TaxID=150365 RepID=A0AAQ3M9A7_9PEZI|nr:Hypothetical protein R9X50_00689300 [Acrodontium crateriforme]